MEAIRLLTQAIDYIEERLQAELEIDGIAAAAHSSKYHFQRMFHALTGFTVTEYVRNRRLTRAAEELSGSDIKVIDLALKYGYETPEAFAKAFRRMHGMTPLAARRSGARLKSFSRLSFHIQIKGETEMNVRITEMEKMKVVGASAKIGDPYTEIEAFAGRVWNDGTHDRINELMGRAKGSLLNGYHYDFGEDGSRRYLMGLELPESIDVPEDLTVLDVTGQSYAVFDLNAVQSPDVEIDTQIHDLWRRIYSEWFPSSSFEQAEGPCIEKYVWTDEDRGEYRSEVWIPVKRKQA